MIILCDSREQKPFVFPKYVRTERVGMTDGDYTVKGYEDYIRIERKSLDDLINCLGNSQLQRYCGQLKRLRKYRYRAVIIEGDMWHVLNGRYRSQLPPNVVIERFMDTCLRFKVLCFFSGNAKSSAILAEQFLRSSVKRVDLGD